VNAEPGLFPLLVAGSLMFESLSGVHVLSVSGYDCVSHMAMPNQNAMPFSNVYDLPGLFGWFAEGSVGIVTFHWFWFPEPATFE